MNIEGQGEGKLTKNYKFSFFVLVAKKINNCLLVDWIHDLSLHNTRKFCPTWQINQFT